MSPSDTSQAHFFFFKAGVWKIGQGACSTGQTCHRGLALLDKIVGQVAFILLKRLFHKAGLSWKEGAIGDSSLL